MDFEFDEHNTDLYEEHIAALEHEREEAAQAGQAPIIWQDGSPLTQEEHYDADTPF